MKSALKNESKDTGCKNRDWNQGRSDFKPLWRGEQSHTPQHARVNLAMD